MATSYQIKYDMVHEYNLLYIYTDNVQSPRSNKQDA